MPTIDLFSYKLLHFSPGRFSIGTKLTKLWQIVSSGSRAAPKRLSAAQRRFQVRDELLSRTAGIDRVD